MFNRVEVDRVVVGAKLLALEEIDGSLVQLKDHDLVEQVQTLNVAICPLN